MTADDDRTLAEVRAELKDMLTDRLHSVATYGPSSKSVSEITEEALRDLGKV